MQVSTAVPLLLRMMIFVLLVFPVAVAAIVGFIPRPPLGPLPAVFSFSFPTPLGRRVMPPFSVPPTMPIQVCLSLPMPAVAALVATAVAAMPTFVPRPRIAVRPTALFCPGIKVIAPQRQRLCCSNICAAAAVQHEAIFLAVAAVLQRLLVLVLQQQERRRSHTLKA